MRFWNKDWSEALCFGLARGLGVFYVKSPYLAASRVLMTRAPNLEERFFNSLDIPFKWKQAKDDEAAWKDTKSDVDAGLPALLQTDLYYLDYYNSKTHFNRHAVLLWGYDEEAGLAYVSDTDREGLMDVPLESLAKARTSKYMPGPVQYDWFPMEDLQLKGSVEDVVLNAVKLCAVELLGPSSERPGLVGLNALREMARDLPNWGEADDWNWCARFAYQIIEKRGTGGSAFRGMYAEFLSEVEQMHPSVAGLNLSDRMEEIARNWSALATLLKDISEMEQAGRLDEAANIAERIYNQENDYCQTVIKAF